MNQNRTAQMRKRAATTGPIKTSLLELLQELSSLAKDDALVLAAVKNIFASYKVHLSRSLIPLRLVEVRYPAGIKARAALRRSPRA